MQHYFARLDSMSLILLCVPVQAFGAAGSSSQLTNPVSSSILPASGTALGLPVSGASQSPFVYDPLAQINIEDLNKAFLERQRASLLGGMYNLRN